MIDNEATAMPGRDERLRKGYVVPAAGQRETLAARRRRQGRREEFAEQAKLAALLARHLDPLCTYWTALENKPRSLLSGLAQRRQGVKSGLPDVLVFQRKPWGVWKPWGALVVFVELKSRRGVASRTQKQVRAELTAAGAVWYMARSARAALTALYFAGVEFCRPFEPPPLEPWEGPFNNPHRRLPQHPEMATRRRAEQQRYRERQRARKAAEIAGLGRSAPQSPTVGATP